MRLSQGVFGKLVSRFAPRLAAGLLYLLDWSMKWDLHFLSSEADVRGALQKPVIFAFWHNQQLVMLFTYRRFFRKLEDKDRKIVTLASRHRDGRLIADTIKFFGIHNLAGSSSRGHLAAVRGMIRGLQEGNHVSITPDGPTGPPREAKQGIIEVARKADTAIIPIGLAASNCWVFKSWDKMFLPKPFSRAQVVFGKPLIANDLSLEEGHRVIKEQLDLAWSTAENLVRNSQ